ncbi:hypothetical protein ACJA28_00150 [Mesomycoplasma moatsii]|uniref:hypothetical protein n=1 Tax=Mesomycoplasma moatsii TaxID=171287 RepID=UPI0003B36726
MSKSNFKLKELKNKYLNIPNFLTSLATTIFSIIFIVIFVYVLDKHWYDGMSTSSIIYIGLGFLLIIFDIAKFDTWNKLKKLFVVKKENNERFTKFEKTQMTILGIKDIDEEKKEKKKKMRLKIRFVSVFMIIYGIILLCISLPFVFINL